MPARDGAMRRLSPYLVALCRQMRGGPTDPEAWLWSCLRGRRLGGAKFRRQRPLGRYIADFCCDDLKLVVELDGSGHAQQKEYDAARDAELGATGHRVIRIANTDIAADPDAVLAGIIRAIDERRSSSPLAHRAAEGGGLAPPPRPSQIETRLGDEG
jgi:very-short-patch-repair endonuclease